MVNCTDQESWQNKANVPLRPKIGLARPAAGTKSTRAEAQRRSEEPQHSNTSASLRGGARCNYLRDKDLHSPLGKI
jgi:hypothetical protein